MRDEFIPKHIGRWNLRLKRIEVICIIDLFCWRRVSHILEKSSSSDFGAVKLNIHRRSIDDDNAFGVEKGEVSQN